jgi:L,D-peptidoglycan transpeptidase YkuD (ErfK/YbiS/YcfS/YnhG family)
MTRRPVLVAALVLALAGCSGGSHGDDGPTAVPQPATTSPATTTSPAPTPTGTPRASTPRPTPARTTPRPTKRPPTVRPAHFPVRVTPGNATQLITVKSSGSRATVTTWAKSASGWHVVAGPWAGRVGSHGVVPGSSRRQGTNTTPGGTFTMTEAFGIAADPGTALPYLHVGNDDWWVEDNNSMYYNSHRRGTQGGFNMSLPESDVNGSERLITHTATYGYAVVVNFNRSPAVRYRGAGIFLHVNGAGATAGCISVPRSAMVTVLRWLRPGAHPRIAIG